MGSRIFFWGHAGLFGPSKKEIEAREAAKKAEAEAAAMKKRWVTHPPARVSVVRCVGTQNALTPLRPSAAPASKTPK